MQPWNSVTFAKNRRYGPSVLKRPALCVGLVILLGAAAVSLAAGPATSRAGSSESLSPGQPAKMLLRVYPESREEAREFLRLGLDIATLRTDPELWVDIIATREELVSLEDRGAVAEVVIADLAAHRLEQFGYMPFDFGPYYTYAEMVEELDSLHARFPDITTEKIDLGASWEGRTIWAMKVSDDPTVEDPDEPEVLINGVQHAREPIGCSICLHTIEYLCQYYGLIPDITEIVDGREAWFVPVVNPDGYVYNETLPDGMWRKNRRDNGGGIYGVDLNRNWGYMWGYDNLGSSPYPEDETYRGPYAFSEPETQAMRSLIDSHEFIFAQDFHSFGDLCLLPYGYDFVYTEDDAFYRVIAESLTVGNGYEYGTLWEVLYIVNGGSIDYEYGEQIFKNKIFGVSHEVGDWFWEPDTNIIIEQCEENLGANLFMLRWAGNLDPDLTVEAYTVVAGGDESYLYNIGDDDGEVDPGEYILLRLDLNNQSVRPADGVTATLSTDSPWVAPFEGVDWSMGHMEFGDVGPGVHSYDVPAYWFKVLSDCPDGETLGFAVEFQDSANQPVGSDTFRIPVFGSDEFPPEFLDVDVTPRYCTVGGQVTITTTIWEGGDIQDVEAAVVAPDSGVVATIPLYDDGAHGDGLPDDRTYGGYWSPSFESDFHVDVTASDEFANDGNGDSLAGFSSLSFFAQGERIVYEHYLVNDWLVAHLNPLPGARAIYPALDAYLSSLNNLGVDHDMWNAFYRGPIDEATLGQYGGGELVAIYPAGAPAQQEQEALRSFLLDGGHLFISGQQLGTALTQGGTQANAFYHDYMHADFVQADVGYNNGWDQLLGAPGDTIGDGLILDLSGPPNTQTFAEEIDPVDPGVTFLYWIPGPIYPLSSGSAGVRVATSVYSVVYTSFCLDGISDTAERDTLMFRILVWLPTTGVAEGEGSGGGDRPALFFAGQSHPNPAPGTCRIAYSLPRRSHVSVRLYNTLGQLVAVLQEGLVDAGPGEVMWDGRDGQGRAVAPGIYLCRLEASDDVAIRKIVLIGGRR